jgi:hypothetical protein
MASKGAFYQKVDQAFYDQVKQENGGKLPPDLTDADGNPRKLTMSAADRGYRQKWLAIAAKYRASKAVVSKDVDSPCVPCAIKAAAAKIPPILLPSKNMGKPAKLKTAPPNEAPPPKTTEPSDEPCKHETLTIECSDEDRGFQLQLPAAGDDEEATTQFEVIDNGKEKVTCTTKITAGPCGASHKGKVFDIYPADSIVSQSDEELVFNANYGTNLTTLSFPDLFPPTKRHDPQVFKISANTCQQDTLSATVAVYPQVDWDLDVSLGFSSKGTASDEGESHLEFKGKIGVTTQGIERSFGVEIKQELANALKAAETAYRTAEWISSISSTLGGIEVTLEEPLLEFSGKWGWREIEKSPKCGFGYTWKILLAPLIGAELKLDILAVLITKIPAIGQIVQRIRQSLDNEVKLEVDLIAEGKVNINFEAEKVEGEPADCSGVVEGELEFKLEGVIKTQQYHFWNFYAGGELKAGGSASFSAEMKGGVDGEGPYYQGEVKFDGLKLYAVVEGGIGYQSDDAPQEDPDYGSPEKGTSGTVNEGIQYTLIPEKTLFDSEKERFMEGDEGGEDGE